MIMISDENIYVKLNFNEYEKMNFKWILLIMKNDCLQNYFQNNFLLRMFYENVS